jgi:hypothetical protein
MDFPNNLVYGYHGTSSVFVSDMLRTGLDVSTFSGNWLGTGFYLWEGDPDHAAVWASKKVAMSGGDPVVIRALVNLSNCLDLCTMRDRMLLQSVCHDWEATLSPGEIESIRQNWGRRELDCEVIDFCLRTVLNEDGSSRYTTVRATFQEGRSSSPAALTPPTLLARMRAAVGGGT